MNQLKTLITRTIRRIQAWRAAREAELMARAASEHMAAHIQYSQARNRAEARLAELKGMCRG